jgi:hypothetical protein
VRVWLSGGPPDSWRKEFSDRLTQEGASGASVICIDPLSKVTYFKVFFFPSLDPLVYII